MITKIILSLAFITFGTITTSCEREMDSCVEDHMENGLIQSDAEDKCNE